METSLTCASAGSIPLGEMPPSCKLISEESNSSISGTLAWSLAHPNRVRRDRFWRPSPSKRVTLGLDGFP